MGILVRNIYSDASLKTSVYLGADLLQVMVIQAAYSFLQWTKIGGAVFLYGKLLQAANGTHVSQALLHPFWHS